MLRSNTVWSCKKRRCELPYAIDICMGKERSRHDKLYSDLERMVLPELPAKGRLTGRAIVLKGSRSVHYIHLLTSKKYGKDMDIHRVSFI